MTSVKSSLAIEGVKYGYGQDKPMGISIKIKYGNGGKEKWTAPVDHTMALEQLACPSVNTCCEYGPT